MASKIGNQDDPNFKSSAYDKAKKSAESADETTVEEIVSAVWTITSVASTIGMVATLIRDLIMVVSTYWKDDAGRSLSSKAYFVALAALIYLISPIDAIPDCIPVVGYVDDTGVIAASWTLIKEDIEQCRNTMKRQGTSTKKPSSDESAS